MIRFQEDASTSLAAQHPEPDETAPIESEEWLEPTQTLSQAMLYRHRIARLEERIMFLEHTLPATLATIMAENQPVCTTLLSLGEPGYKVLKSIPVTIRLDGEEFVATFFDANISTGGDTQQEAVANLQSLIADFCDELTATPQTELGPSLQRQKRVLAEFICQI